jgi:HEAT repeat protein
MPSSPVSATAPRRAFVVAAALLLTWAAWPADVAGEPPSATASQAATDVLALLTGDDADLRQVALDRIRHGLRGEQFTTAVAEVLPRLAAAEQRAVLLALADRGDPAAVAAATAAAGRSTDDGVRAAALAMIGRLGGADDVGTLVASLAAGGAAQDAARRGLVEIRGPGVAEAIRAAAAGPAAARPTVIDVLAERRDREAVPLLVTAAVADEPAVRGAAMRALGVFGGAAEVPTMVASLVKASGDERATAERGLVAVCTSGRQAAAATEALVGAYAAADAAARRTILPALARVGGPKVMVIVDAMLADPATRAQGLDALSKWPDATVKDRLLELLGGTTDPQEKELVLGTLIRIAPLPDNKLSDGQKLELLQKTMGLCDRTEDQARVLERANAIRTIETFRFVVPYLDEPALAEPACRSVVELAHHQKLRDAHKQEFTSALDKVLGLTKNAELRERATRYKAGQTWDRKKKG